MSCKRGTFSYQKITIVSKLRVLAFKHILEKSVFLQVRDCLWMLFRQPAANGTQDNALINALLKCERRSMGQGRESCNAFSLGVFQLCTFRSCNLPGDSHTLMNSWAVIYQRAVSVGAGGGGDRVACDSGNHSWTKSTNLIQGFHWKNLIFPNGNFKKSSKHWKALGIFSASR